MASNAIGHKSQGTWRTEKYFGSSTPQRTTFVVLISILAWMLAAVLVIFVLSAHAPYPVSAFAWLFVVFHLMPWFVGLRNLRRVKRALNDKMIDTAAANLSYSLVLGMLLNTYVVLCSGETLAILAYRLGTLHLL
jgi:Flp pilus assembly protein TadB